MEADVSESQPSHRCLSLPSTTHVIAIGVAVVALLAAISVEAATLVTLSSAAGIYSFFHLRRTSILAQPQSSPATTPPKQPTPTTPTAAPCPVCLTNCNRHAHTTGPTVARVPACVDTEVRTFIDDVLRHFVTKAEWYVDALGTEEVEDDGEAFGGEIRNHIRLLLNRVLLGVAETVKRYDTLSRVLLLRFAPLLLAHFKLFFDSDCDAQKHIETLRQRRDVLMHSCLRSRASELAHLRSLSLALLDRCLSETPLVYATLHSSIVRQMVPDVLSRIVLMRLFDLVAEPTTIGDLLDMIFGPEPSERYDLSLRDPLVPVLLCSESDKQRLLTAEETDDMSERKESFVPISSVAQTTSLLQLKLSDILLDQRLLYVFMKFLKQCNGPVNQLQFTLSATELQNAISRYDYDPNDVSENSVPSELHWEAWELFKQYFHTSSPDFLKFPANLQSSFKAAVEADCYGKEWKNQLEVALNAAYHNVYTRLHGQWVHPFCSSEHYFEFLVGGRLEVPTPIVTTTSMPEVTAVMDLPPGSQAPSIEQFSLNKIRSKLTKLLNPIQEGIFFLDDIQSESSDLDEQQLSEMSPGPDSGILAGTSSVDDSALDRLSIPDRSSLKLSLSENELDDYGFDFGPMGVCPAALEQNMSQVTPTPRSMSIRRDFVSLERDLSQWDVNIRRIEPRRETSGTMIYVYVIDVDRQDVENGSPDKSWTVDRRYREFYVLESKLNEFHGNTLTFKPLPPKRSFGTKQRTFLETQRSTFAEFLVDLVDSPELSGSELLFSFLTSPVEFTNSSIIPDALNPLRAMKAVPQLLIPERGQNLEQFIHTFVHSCETFRHNKQLSSPKPPPDEDVQTVPQSVKAEWRLDSARNEYHQDVYCTMYGDNFNTVRNEASSSKEASIRPDQFSNSFDLLLYGVSEVLKCHQPVQVAAAAIRSFYGAADASAVIEKWLDEQLQQALYERRIAKAINFLRTTVLSDETKQEEPSQPPQHDDLNERFPSLARLAPFIGLDLTKLLSCFNSPLLNKHLFYVLLDAILDEVFRDEPIVKRSQEHSEQRNGDVLM